MVRPRLTGLQSMVVTNAQKREARWRRDSSTATSGSTVAAGADTGCFLLCCASAPATKAGDTSGGASGAPRDRLARRCASGTKASAAAGAAGGAAAPPPRGAAAPPPPAGAAAVAAAGLGLRASPRAAPLARADERVLILRATAASAARVPPPQSSSDPQAARRARGGRSAALKSPASAHAMRGPRGASAMIFPAPMQWSRASDHFFSGRHAAGRITFIISHGTYRMQTACWRAAIFSCLASRPERKRQTPCRLWAASEEEGCEGPRGGFHWGGRGRPQ